jgi:hypothetical protein
MEICLKCFKSEVDLCVSCWLACSDTDRMGVADCKLAEFRAGDFEASGRKWEFVKSGGK